MNCLQRCRKCWSSSDNERTGSEFKIENTKSKKHDGVDIENPMYDKEPVAEPISNPSVQNIYNPTGTTATENPAYVQSALNI